MVVVCNQWLKTLGLYLNIIFCKHCSIREPGKPGSCFTVFRISVGMVKPAIITCACSWKFGKQEVMQQISAGAVGLVIRVGES